MARQDLQQVKQRFGIIGNNDVLLRAIDIALQVAPTDLSVLITGESGVGKEVFPQIIHQNSARKHDKYIAVNCGAIPEGTIDSELFGHEKGSFTGATSDRKGYFEEASGGTIFLDEVGELPLSTQARLLRVLESGEFIKVGSSKVLKTNVRIVAATNVDMHIAIRNGKFREDLFYRLNTVPIQIPALRERKEDINLLFRKFCNDFAEKYRMPSISLTDTAKELLASYRWPGNIRQLKNIAEQISIIETSRDIDEITLKFYLPKVETEKLPALQANDEDNILYKNEREILYQIIFEMRKELNELKGIVYNNNSATHVPATTQSVVLRNKFDFQPVQELSSQDLTIEDVSQNIPVASLHPIHLATAQPKNIGESHEYVEETLSLEDMEKEVIKQALIRNNGKRKKAADDLKISERTLYRKIKEYDLE
ncbi:MAG: sigma-54 dependent transcriptional regulator [Bacteroidales bacterium]|nr:sigma-54 dependent transcriptional regulator [Bacteroidales bacterium]